MSALFSSLRDGLFHRPSALLSFIAVAVTLALSGCGGGGNDNSVAFDIAVVVDGQPSGSHTGAGNSSTIYVRVGQSFELDASEPVIWTLYVADTAVSGSGTTVHYAGADVTLIEESPSRIAIDTFAAAPLADPIPLTLVATSTIDSAEVATVDVLITN